MMTLRIYESMLNIPEINTHIILEIISYIKKEVTVGIQ